MHTASRLTIDLSAIVHNWQALHALAHGAEVAAVVKADAYGHGAVRVAPALARAGCRTFFTASVPEAVIVREAAGAGPDILVLHGTGEAEAPLALRHRLVPVINTLSQLRDWHRLGLAETGPAVLHFDTGMNRLGLRPEDLPAVRQMMDGAEVGLVMSHLACADEPGHPMNASQRDDFLGLAAAWPAARRSLASSAGMALEGCRFDLVRPGIALYGGGGPLPLGGERLRPGMCLEAPILSVFMAPKGASTGYGASRRFGRHHRLATIALGYADGLPRALSNHGFALVGGQRCRMVGRVSMDLVTLDVTDLECPVAPGMMVEIFGPHASIEAQAAEAGTLGYELMTGVGPRVERLWHE